MTDIFNFGSEGVDKGILKEDVEISIDPDDGDPVVQEFQVVLNRDMEDWACLLRYPHQPITRDTPEPTVARLKPKSDLLEFEYDVFRSAPLRDEYEHFDLPGDVQNMPNAERKKIEDQYRNRSLRSVRVDADDRAYAMGLIDHENDTFTLVPLHGVYEMRPVLQAPCWTGGDELLTNKEPVQEEKKEVGPIAINVVQFRKQAQQGELDRLTYQKLRSSEDKEQWISMDIISRESQASANVLQDHLTSESGHNDDWIDELNSDEDDEDASRKESSEIEGEKLSKKEVIRRKLKHKRDFYMDPHTAFDLSQTEILDFVAPRTRHCLDGQSVQVLDSNVAADADASTGSKVGLEAQIRSKLLRRGVLMFSDILPAVQTTGGEQTIKRALEILPEIAYMIHGAWVIKSEEYCREQYGDYRSTPDFFKKCSIRDLVLCLLAISDVCGIAKEVIKDMGVKVSPDDLQAALMSVCELDKDTRLWRLKNVDKDAAKWEKSHQKLALSQQELLKGVMFKSLTELNVDEEQAKLHVNGIVKKELK